MAAAALGRLLQDRIVSTAAAPGASAAIAQRVDGAWLSLTAAAGRMDPFGAEPVTPHTWYDLASITKSVTAVSVARAVDAGLLRWETPLAAYLPELMDTYAGGASLERLLSHRAGLVAHVPAFEEPAAALRRMANASRYQSTPTTVPNAGRVHAPLYSDVGYILLGKALQHVTAQPLDEWLSGSVTTGSPTALLSARQMQRQGVPMCEVAPTELVPYRGGLVRGQVHDDNAWALSETNTSGHAGLFGTAASVAAFGTLLLDCLAGRSRLLSTSALEVLLAPRDDGVLRAGFDGKSPHASSVGRELGSRTFGHLGFTGTSYWCDPDSETVVVLLTNRVCPSRDNPKLKALRPLVHDELAQLARALEPANAAPLGLAQE